MIVFASAGGAASYFSSILSELAIIERYVRNVSEMFFATFCPSRVAVVLQCPLFTGVVAESYSRYRPCIMCTRSFCTMFHCLSSYFSQYSFILRMHTKMNVLFFFHK
jgi:hypothetical protein